MQLPRWLLAPCLASIAACAPVQFTHQELLIRHTPDKDTLDVCLIYREVTSSDSEDRLAKAYRFASAVAGGKRELMIFDWPLHFDLDKFEAGAIEPGPWAELEREAKGCVAGMSIRSAGLFAELSGKFSMYQVLRVEQAQRFVALINAALHTWIREKGDAELADDLPRLDASTRALWRKLGNDRTPWLFLRDGALELDLPISPACAATMFREILAESEKDKDFAKYFGCLLDPLAKLEVAGDHLRCRFASEDGVLRWELVNEIEYEPALRDRIASEGPTPDPKLDLESVRRLLEKP